MCQMIRRKRQKLTEGVLGGKRAKEYNTYIPLDPKTMKNAGFTHPQHMGEITPKNEGLTWVPMVLFTRQFWQVRRCDMILYQSSCVGKP